VAHLEENVTAAQVRLSETDLAELDKLAEPA
jgi:aryl-alcohol dehydrogenase-like predicted oxidoreductase